MQCDASGVSVTPKANFNNKITQHYLCAVNTVSSLDSMAALLIDLFFSCPLFWGGDRGTGHLRILGGTVGKARRCGTPLGPDLSGINPRNSYSCWLMLGVYIRAPWLGLGLLVSGWTRMVLCVQQLSGIGRSFYLMSVFHSWFQWLIFSNAWHGRVFFFYCVCWSKWPL